MNRYLKPTYAWSKKVWHDKSIYSKLEKNSSLKVTSSFFYQSAIEYISKRKLNRVIQKEVILFSKQIYMVGVAKNVTYVIESRLQHELYLHLYTSMPLNLLLFLTFISILFVLNLKKKLR
jgi:hypothetical protein